MHRYFSVRKEPLTSDPDNTKLLGMTEKQRRINHCMRQHQRYANPCYSTQNACCRTGQKSNPIGQTNPRAVSNLRQSQEPRTPRPLNVKWFCARHHKAEHRNNMTTRKRSMATKAMATNEVKDYLRRIGSKGGKLSAQHPNRSQLNRAAANARWRRQFPAPKKVAEA
jgi:hypothetical protein